MLREGKKQMTSGYNNIKVQTTLDGTHVTIQQGLNIIHLSVEDAKKLRQSLLFLTELGGNQIEEITSTLQPIPRLKPMGFWRNQESQRLPDQMRWISIKRCSLPLLPA
jgi:hypothetical protein